MTESLMQSPIHGHVRYLTNFAHLPDNLRAVAAAFEHPGRALAHEDAEGFEAQMGDHPALMGSPHASLKEVLEGLPDGAMRKRAQAKVERARAEVRCDDFDEALHLLIEAKDCAVRALV